MEGTSVAFAAVCAALTGALVTRARAREHACVESRGGVGREKKLRASRAEKADARRERQWAHRLHKREGEKKAQHARQRTKAQKEVRV